MLMPEVLLRADPGDGNDPLEATVDLPIVPRKGDVISVWVSDRFGSGTEMYPEVKDVALCAWAPERIEVYLSTDALTDEDLRQMMEAAAKGETP